MAGNSEKIDEVIDPAALKQVVDLTTAVNALEKQFIDSAKAAIQLNNITGNNTKTFQDYSKNTSNTALETAKLTKMQAEAEKATLSLQQARQKAADDYATKLKREVELAEKAAEAQRKLQEAADKRASIIGPTITGSVGDSAELTSAQVAALQAKNQAQVEQRVAAIAAANAEAQRAAAEKEAAQVDAESTTQTKAKTESLSASQKIINQYSGSLSDNIKRQIDLSAELKSVQADLKNITGTTEQARNAQANLTAEETRLKLAIQQNGQVIKQQTKDELNATTSADGLNARLALLRSTFNSLTESERNNAQVGGVLLKEITDLDAKTKQIAESQGMYNKSVGDYETKIKSAISSYVPFGKQLVAGIDALKGVSKQQDQTGSSLGQLALGFAGFTIGAFAVAIVSARYYLSQFQDTANNVEQRLNGLKNVFSKFGQSELSGGGNIFKALASLFAPFGQGQQFFGDKIDSIKKAFAQGKDIAKATQDLQAFNEVNDEQVKAQQAQADQFRAMAKNRSLDTQSRQKYLKDAQAIERQILNSQRSNSELNIEIAIEVSDKVKKIDSNTRAALGKGDLALANALVRSGDMTSQGYDLYKQAIDRKIQAQSSATMKLIRQQNDEDNLMLKSAKAANNDQLELDKARIEQAKINAKLIVDDEQQTFQARLVALGIFEKKSKQLIENERKTANAAPGTSSVKKQANGVVAQTQLGQVDLQVLNDQKKIYADYYAYQAKLINTQLDKEYLANKTREDNLKKSNDKLLQESQESTDAQLEILIKSYAKGEISQQEYQSKREDIERAGALNVIGIQIQGIEELIELEKKAGLDTAVNEKKLSDLKIRYSKSTTDKQLADAERLAARKKEISNAEKQLGDEVLNLSQTLIDARYQRELNGIQDQKDALTNRTQNEIDAENRSLDSAQTKADKIAVINAKAAAQQEQLDQKARETKQKQAQADRIFAIAKIIENTAIGVSSALAEYPPNIPLAIIVGALGAAQIANVLATPIPKYEKGTDNAKGGLSIVGEAGREYVLPPHGDGFFTPDSASFMDIPKGSKVIPHHELFALMANPNKPSFTPKDRSDRRMIEAINSGNTKLVRAVRQNKAKTVVYVDTLKSSAHNNKRNIHFK